jgi:hypothetical protein
VTFQLWEEEMNQSRNAFKGYKGIFKAASSKGCNEVKITSNTTLILFGWSLCIQVILQMVEHIN